MRDDDWVAILCFAPAMIMVAAMVVALIIECLP